MASGPLAEHCRTVPKGLLVRWHRCSYCGAVLDRDENAALNILRKWQRLLAGETRTARR